MTILCTYTYQEACAFIEEQLLKKIPRIEGQLKVRIVHSATGEVLDDRKKMTKDSLAKAGITYMKQHF